MGGLLVHNTDIASISDRTLAGFSLVGSVLVIVAVVIASALPLSNLHKIIHKVN